MPLNKTKKILAISGSLRKSSSNHAILNFLAGLVPDHVEFHIYDGLALLPHFNQDFDNDDAPETVQQFRKLLFEADAVVICTPEYAYGVPGSLKNALDWTVSSGSFIDKPTLLITASLGGESAHSAMQLILGALSANVLKEAALLISFVRSKIDGEGNVIDLETANSLKAAFNELAGNLQ